MLRSRTSPFARMLHRFGLLCFWASVAIAVALGLFAVALLIEGQNSLSVTLLAMLQGCGGYLAAGSAIRFIFGWRASDV